jgi:hypothetical protein
VKKAVALHRVELCHGCNCNAARLPPGQLLVQARYEKLNRAF